MKMIFVILIVLPLLLFGNQAPIIDSFQPSQYTVLPNGTVEINLSAHDPDCTSSCTTGCGMYIRADLTVWTSSEGTFLSKNNGTSGSPYTASAIWQAPNGEGNYIVSVQIGDSGSFLCGGRKYASASFNIQVSSNLNNPPIINYFIAEKNPILLNTSTILSADAYDPDGDEIIYEFFASTGEIYPIDSKNAHYFAPNYPTLVNLTVRVTDTKGSYSTENLNLYVTSLIPEKRIYLEAPFSLRFYLDNQGEILVATKNYLKFYDIFSGEKIREIFIQDLKSISKNWSDNIFVSTRNSLKLLNWQGNLILNFEIPTEIKEINEVFCDNLNKKYLALSSNQGKIIIYDEFGNLERVFGGTGDGEGEFKKAAGFAVYENKIYVGDVGHGKVKVFDYYGNLINSFGERGGEEGKFSQISSLSLDLDGNIYVVDSLKSQIVVYNNEGNLREIYGKYGENLGELILPSFVSINNLIKKLGVLNQGDNSLEIFTIASSSSQENIKPSTPEPHFPLSGQTIPEGEPVNLIVRKSIDPDSTNLIYLFEFYENQGSETILLASWFNSSQEDLVSVDATNYLNETTSYSWRCRAYDFKDWSEWTPLQDFTVEMPIPNTPPTSPSSIEPIGGVEVPTLEPELIISNSYDKEGDDIYYIFEIYTHLGTIGYKLLHKSNLIAQGDGGTTSYKVPLGILKESQEIFWKAIPFDGKAYGESSNFENFITKPFDLPLKEEVGNLEFGDDTRPFFVNFKIPPQNENIKIYYQIFGELSEGEIQLIVNGNYTHNLPPFEGNDWSYTHEEEIPLSELNGEGENFIKFYNTTNKNWGLRFVTLNAPKKPALQAISYNTVIDLIINLPPNTKGKVEIYKSLSPLDTFTFLKELDSSVNILRDTNLTNEVYYYYFAILKDYENFESPPSNIVFGKPEATFTTPITDLLLLKSNNDIILQWSNITNSPPLEDIEIYRDDDFSFIPDTENFTNLIDLINPSINYFKDDEALNRYNFEWYLVIPKDSSGRRGLP